MSDSDTSSVPAPPPLFYLGGFLVGVALEAAFPIDGPPTAVRVLGGIGGAALWLALDGKAMFSFGRAGTSMNPFKASTALVTSGPYGVTRNPMYVGMGFLYIGLALALGVIWALVVLPGAILAVDRLVIAREEAYLERRFGAPYREYLGRVRRWL